MEGKSLTRPRSSSQPPILDYIKRKREGEAEGTELTKRSSRAQKSPPKQATRAEEKDSQQNREMGTEIILQAIEGLRAEMKQEIQALRKENNDFKEMVANERQEWKKEMEDMRNEMSEMKRKMTNMENQGRRDNIVVRGIPEENGNEETWEACAVKVTQLSTQLNVEIKKTDIVRAHRLGRPTDGKTRPIIAKLASWNLKERVMANKKNMKGTNLFIDEDYASETIEEIKHLREAAKRIRDEGKYAAVIFNKLKTDDGFFVWSANQQKLIKVGENIRRKFPRHSARQNGTQEFEYGPGPSNVNNQNFHQ